MHFDWSPLTGYDSAKPISTLFEPSPLSIDVRKTGIVSDLCIESAISICVNDVVREPVCGIYSGVADPVKSTSAA
jgi:hypothetical protein